MAVSSRAMSSLPVCISFDNLPEEIIVYVLSYLSPQQVQHLRRVYRRFNLIILKYWRHLPLLPAEIRMKFGLSSVSIEVLSPLLKKFTEIHCQCRGKVVGRFLKPLKLLDEMESKRKKFTKIHYTGNGLCDAVLQYVSILATQFKFHIQQISLAGLQCQFDLFCYCLIKTGLKISSAHVELNISNEKMVRKFFKLLKSAGCKKYIIDDFVSGKGLHSDIVSNICPFNVYLHRIYVRITSLYTISDTIEKWKIGLISIGIIRYVQCDIPTENVACHLSLPMEGEGFFVSRSLDKKVLRFENFPAHSRITEERVIFVCERKEDLTQELREEIKMIVLKN